MGKKLLTELQYLIWPLVLTIQATGYSYRFAQGDEFLTFIAIPACVIVAWVFGRMSGEASERRK